MDLENIACDYVENEVGRLDWVNNWNVYKQKHNVVENVSTWLQSLGLNADPDAVIRCIDLMAETRPGKWQ